MTTKFTPTFALIIAGGLAAGIALARPATETPQAAGPPATAATAQQAGAATNGYGREASPAVPQPQPAVVLTIADFAFGAPLTVAPGQVVAVDNIDAAPHTVTFDNGTVDTGIIDGGGAGSFVAPTEPGTYTFFCTVHPAMQGQLTVR